MKKTHGAELVITDDVIKSFSGKNQTTIRVHSSLLKNISNIMALYLLLSIKSNRLINELSRYVLLDRNASYTRTQQIQSAVTKT